MAIAPGCWRRSSTRPNRLRACARRTGFGWVRPAVAVARIARDAAPETRKAVYMYALEPAWHTRLAVPAPVLAPLAVGDGLDAAVWAASRRGAFGRRASERAAGAERAANGRVSERDRRRPRRRAMVKGHYRLIDQPADSAVIILAPHREQTLRRMQAHHGAVHPGRHPVELHPARAAAIGSNQTGAAWSCTRRPIPTGWRWACCGPPSTRRPRRGGRRAAPEAARGAQVVRWIEGLRDCAQAAEQLSETRVVCWTARPISSTCSSSTARLPSRSTCWSAPRPTRPRQGKDARRADGLTPSVLAAKVEVQRLSARVKASKQARKDRRAERVAAALPAGAAALPRRRAGRTVGRPRARGTTTARLEPHIPFLLTCP